jgi:hypothetical protein
MLPKGRTPKLLPWRFANLLTRSSTFQEPSFVASSVPSIQHLVPEADLCVVDNACNISGSFFMTREVELCLAVGEHIDSCWKAMNDTWNLPASKTDPKALGKRRTWGCVCDGDLGSKWASLKSDTLIALCETLDCRQKKVALPPLVDPDAAAVSSCRTLAPARMLDAHFVRNDASGIVHRPLSFSHEFAREAWRTAFGWAFAEASFSTREVLTTRHRH